MKTKAKQIKLKAPKRPIEPLSPYPPPVVPQETIEQSKLVKKIYLLQHQHFTQTSLMDLIKEEIGAKKIDNLKLSFAVETCDEYNDPEIILKLIDAQTVKNPRFAKEQKYYLEASEKFKKERALYQIKLKQYKKEMEQYQLELDQYHLDASKAMVAKLEAKINKNKK